MEVGKHKELKSKDLILLKELFTKLFNKAVKQFVDYRTDLVHEIVPDEEEVAIDAIPLATKPPTIVDWKIHKEGKKNYYQIIRVNRSSKIYLVFSHMLKSFDTEDFETLWKLFNEEERLTKEKDEANVALTKEWDDIQAKVDTDYQLAQRLQAEEQEQFTTEQKATLFKELREQRRKHLAAKRAEEKRNKPPTKTQQKKTMITYLKNMEGSSKRAGDELKQEVTKKQKVDDVQETAKVDDDQEATKIKELMEIVLDEEEVAIDAILLATKPPTIC
ncbi:hypothetical protein Tco_0506161 [Tanacetum coccineum]